MDREYGFLKHYYDLIIQNLKKDIDDGKDLEEELLYAELASECPFRSKEILSITKDNIIDGMLCNVKSSKATQDCILGSIPLSVYLLAKIDNINRHKLFTKSNLKIRNNISESLGDSGFSLLFFRKYSISKLYHASNNN